MMFNVEHFMSHEHTLSITSYATGMAPPKKPAPSMQQHAPHVQRLCIQESNSNWPRSMTYVTVASIWLADACRDAQRRIRSVVDTGEMRQHWKRSIVALEVRDQVMLLSALLNANLIETCVAKV